MKTHSFYDPATGLFTGCTFSTSLGDAALHAEALSLNTPNGLAHIEGRYDHLSQRVNVERLAQDNDAAATAWAATREDRDLAAMVRARAQMPSQTPLPAKDPPPPPIKVGPQHIIDYQPPAPSGDHEWRTSSRRWRLTAPAQEKLGKSRAAISQIERLDKESITALRDLAMDAPGAKEKLEEINTQIATLRKAVQTRGVNDGDEVSEPAG